MGHKSEAPRAAPDPYAAAQAEIARQERRFYEQYYKPIEIEQIKQLRKPLKDQMYFKRMTGDIERSYGDIGGATRRTLGGRYQYGSGYEGAAARNLGLSKAGTRASAWQAGEEARQAGLLQMMGMGRGLQQQVQTGLGAGSSSSLARSQMQSQREQARMQGITSGVTGCMCRKFIAGKELTENVVRFRDAFFEKGSFIDLGYKLDSMISVPLMKNKTFRFLAKWLCLKPLGAYADFFFGKNRWGFLLSPIGFWWVGFWVITGATISQVVDLSSSEEKFRQEVAQCLSQT
jgi:hypothetical protein